MKLPDFQRFEQLNSLRTRMGIAPNTFGNIKAIEFKANTISYEELKSLATVGLEVNLQDVIVLQDGTLGHKGKRVLLHIRDVSDHGRSYSDPRFHIANCETLRQMRVNNRFGRYVVATREDGYFTLYYGLASKEAKKKLEVCQNCLEFLSYQGFMGTAESGVRKHAVNRFLISEFFQKYPKSLHSQEPRYTDTNAPLNTYSADWDVISKQVKIERRWQCEASDCRIILSESSHRQYLHAHHVNGLKYDNSPNNLKLYCLHCHANQPMHSHMKPMANDASFQLIRNQLLKKGPLK